MFNIRTIPLENFLQGCNLYVNLPVYKMIKPKHKSLFFCKGRYAETKC